MEMNIAKVTHKYNMLTIADIVAGTVPLNELFSI